ncbi:hypothetical protein [Aeromonas hydrophila]|uniref:hypothetical protein n=1 Tax=Aeromonas hydrophila TaxID=644 RepID=UPI001CC3D5E1|nr:hypothetical protein [Aeromonas hydrophila]
MYLTEHTEIVVVQVVGGMPRKLLMWCQARILHTPLVNTVILTLMVAHPVSVDSSLQPEEKRRRILLTRYHKVATAGLGSVETSTQLAVVVEMASMHQVAERAAVGPVATVTAPEGTAAMEPHLVWEEVAAAGAGRPMEQLQAPH